MNPVKLVLGGIAAVLVAGIFFGTYFTVEPNERTVVMRFGEISYVAGPGLHFKLPFVNNTHTYKTDIQSVQPKAGVNTYTVDNQEVDIVFNVFYRIAPDQVAFIHTNVQDYKQRLFTMAVDRLKVEVGKVNVTAIAEERGALRDAVKTVLTHDAKSIGVEVTDFTIPELVYDEAFRKAVSAAAVQKAAIETREYERQQAQKTAERAAIEAEGRANALREEAKGQADANLLVATAAAKAIQLRGEAEAAAIKAQAEALKQNQQLVELRKAEKWNGELPRSMLSNVVPFMNVEQQAFGNK